MTGLASIYDGREKPWHCSCALVISSDVYDRSPLEKLEKIVRLPVHGNPVIEDSPSARCHP